MLNKRLMLLVVNFDGMRVSIESYIGLTYEEFVKGCVCGDFDNREFHHV